MLGLETIVVIFREGISVKSRQGIYVQFISKIVVPTIYFHCSLYEPVRQNVPSRYC